MAAAPSLCIARKLPVVATITIYNIIIYLSYESCFRYDFCKSLAIVPVTYCITVYIISKIISNDEIDVRSRRLIIFGA